MNKITFRIATFNDIENIISLCQSSIKSLCINDYSAQQMESWSNAVNNPNRFKVAIENQYFIVALINDEITGFASLSTDGLIDFMFVAPNFINQGIAQQLYEHLEQEAVRKNLRDMHSYVSKTAMGFFLKNGFKKIRKNMVNINGVELENYFMNKSLDKV